MALSFLRNKPEGIGNTLMGTKPQIPTYRAGQHSQVSMEIHVGVDKGQDIFVCQIS